MTRADGSETSGDAARSLDLESLELETEVRLLTGASACTLAPEPSIAG